MRPHPLDPDRLTPRERYRLELARRDAKVAEGWDKLIEAVARETRPHTWHRQRLELITPSTREQVYE